MKRIRSGALALLLLWPGLAAAQGAREYVLQGTVVAATTQQPISGAEVVITRTGFGTLTDDAGRFQLRATLPPGDYSLAVSFIGRGTVTIPITLGAQTTVALETVTLEESAVELDEIVVTGTGVSAERRAVGNTVATVRGEDINDAPSASTIDKALQGKIAGAVISQNNGQPGGGVSIRLRGTSSILGGAEPLIVVDGVIIENNSTALVGLSANATRSNTALSNRLGDIPASDIERIEVLKGAAAAALYGSRANSGVIQIFTKRGLQGEPRIQVVTEHTLSSVADKYEILSSPVAGPGDVTFGPADAVGDPVDRFLYQDDLFQTGYGTTNQVTLSGGAAGTTYYLSGNLTENEGAIRGSDFGRTGARLKLTQRVSDWLTVGANGNFLQTQSNFIPEGEQTQGVLTTLIFTPSTFDPTFDPNTGRYPYSPIIGTNPFDVIDNWTARSDVNRFIGAVNADARLTDDLQLSFLLGIDDSREEATYLQPPFSTGTTFQGSLQNPIRSVRRYNTDLTANHELGLTPSIALTSTGGFRYTFDRTDIIRPAATGLNPGQETLGLGGAVPSATQAIAEIATAGGFLQERLSFNDRLYLTGGLNVEASSAFGADERWQFFPRVSGSWVVSEEPFFPTADLLSTLRLRLAYGETGGQPPGAYFRFTTYGNTAHAGRPGFEPSTLAGNPNLKPERQREWEGGFDLGLFDERLALEFTYYDQRTDDLVLSIPLPLTSGFTSQFQNIGEVSNKGLELTLNTVNIDRNGIRWNSRLTYAANRNRVEDLGIATDSVNYAYLNYVVEGEPIGVFVGAFYPRDANGDIIFSGPGGIPRRARGCDPELGCPTASDSITLRKVIGDPNPDFTLALSNELSFGESLQLSFLLDGRFGNDVANFSRRIMDYFGVSTAIEREISGEVPVGFHFLNLERHLLYEAFIEDGSFVKLREIALRYALPSGAARLFGADRAALTLSGRNLYTWTDYSGLDPEINLFAASTVARGVDFATSPIPRTFGLRLDFSF